MTVARPFPVRAALVLLAAAQGVPGAWALLAPRSFYADFPLPGYSWVAAFPPYNEHLVRDIGGLSLALTAVLVAAAVSLDRRLARAAAFGCLTFTVPHLVFHAGHLGMFAAVDVAGQLCTQIGPLLLSLLILLLTPRNRQGNAMGAIGEVMSRDGIRNLSPAATNSVRAGEAGNTDRRH